jgi:3-methyl-2-oxobutanoate hydroxymethyltransferase
MVLQGKNSTLPVTMDDMVYHTECVMRGNSEALIMADLPFMANNSVQDTLNNAGRLMQAGANIVKVEGEAWLANSITALSQRGIPVCAHLGLTPQSVNKLGGYKVQGKNLDAADRMLAAAQSLEEAGADLLLLECVPRSLAEKITQQVSIPVIGIGAGNVTDGQVLVLHDMLGITPGNKPRFVKNFMTETNNILDALKAYDNAVKSSIFPAEEHSFKN